MMKTQFERDMDFLDAISHELAMVEAEGVTRQPETAQEKALIDRVSKTARRQIRALRRKAFDELRKARAEPELGSLPARILAMTRDAILERLRDLELGAPVEFQVAYRKLDELALDDLRVMLTDVEEILGEAGE